MDPTLECVRRHYLGQPNPLAETLVRYGDFFGLFGRFRGYVDLFLLQDLVETETGAVRFFMDFDDFATAAVPVDVGTYVGWRPCANPRRAEPLRNAAVPTLPAAEPPAHLCR
jgi:hypothetical protein